MPQPRTAALIALAAAVTVGTIYSAVYGTYLDTSDPSISSLPHPLAAKSYFASKDNIFNTWFVKRAWGWTTLAFAGLYATSPPTTRTRRRIAQYAIATLMWILFTSWFFGPAVIDRVVSLSGGECVVVLPHSEGAGAEASQTMVVPAQFCDTRTRLSPTSHPDLFVSSFAMPHDNWSARPRYLKGHDVSGHVFLLTLSVLFLADQLKPSLDLYASQRTAKQLSGTHHIVLNLTFALSALWFWMTYMTSVYWHKPMEKVTGFGLGILAYLVTRLSEQL